MTATHAYAGTASEAAMDNIRIGTSGYSFDDWVGSFYPPALRRTERLAFYSRHFDVVEINATYYRIPSRASFEAMARKTPPDFTFIVKGPRSMTHDRDLSGAFPTDWDTFISAVEPLREAEKLDGILLQFPYAFRYGRASLDYLKRVRDRLGFHRVFVEFRHVSWNSDDTFEYLRRHRIGYCAVDEPELPGLMPPVVRQTGNVGYIRFHGRNRTNWWGDGRGDRYDHTYTRSELDEWIGKIRELASQTARTYVFFNNCHDGQAVQGARLLADMLKVELGDHGQTWIQGELL
jgi:uncharacterized protein YecE (DUF72 family)